MWRMTSTTLPPKLFVDTQVLVSAYREGQPEWRQFIEGFLDDGYQLVLSGEHLLEFAQYEDLGSNERLLECLLNLSPAWLKSFSDIQISELNVFLPDHLRGRAVAQAWSPFADSFEGTAELSDRKVVSAMRYLQAFSTPAGRAALQKLRGDHAHVLNTLVEETAATAAKRLAPDQLKAANSGAVLGRLRMGNRDFEPLMGEALTSAAAYCMSQWPRLAAACPSFTVEEHLSNYRSSSAQRKARLSDSVDLTISAAALAYVGVFITNDGYLHSGLAYVLKRMPGLGTQLLRSPTKGVAVKN